MATKSWAAVRVDKHGRVVIPTRLRKSLSPLITLPDAAKDFVRGGGGSLYIWPSRHRCCSGTLTLLEAGSTAPAAKRIWTRVDQADIQVFLDSSIPEAQEIDVLLRRWPRPHLTAFWNGCAWVG